MNATAERCPYCGEPQILDVFEVWSDHNFMLDTCCEGLRDAAAQQLDDDYHQVDGLRSSSRWFAPIMEKAVGYALRRVIPHAGSLLADYALSIRPVDFATALAFVREHHAHCRPPAGWKFGAQIVSGSTRIGVVIVGRPVARMLDRTGTTLEVTRLCLDRTLPDPLRWNACSMLYSWAAREARKRGASRIISYTRDDESGASLIAAGWKIDRRSAGGSWSRQGRRRASINTVPKHRWCRVL